MKLFVSFLLLLLPSLVLASHQLHDRGLLDDIFGGPQKDPPQTHPNNQPAPTNPPNNPPKKPGIVDNIVSNVDSIFNPNKPQTPTESRSSSAAPLSTALSSTNDAVTVPAVVMVTRTAAPIAPSVTGSLYNSTAWSVHATWWIGAVIALVFLMTSV
ncbi:uncharacterized protein VTP21DRAFT_2316 [Calcarisporiella thermophila]|uniref:uncharacterized protein n=1 Tax=Calcarisporiella thermophila TaxID=911321 RepID=UPI00374238C0